MKNYYSIIVTIVLLMGGSGCEKDELTLPVRVDFFINLKNKSTHYISFESGLISISRISFEGRRDVGENVYFDSNPNLLLENVAFSSIPDSSITHFDIPQGVYYYSNWKIYLKELDPLSEEIEIDDDNVGLLLTGTYASLNGNHIKVYITINSFEFFSIQAADEYGNSTITLSAEKRYDAILQFDMEYVFGGISQTTMEELEVEDEDDDPLIVISSDSNQSLYELILYRIQKSAKIIIQ